MEEERKPHRWLWLISLVIIGVALVLFEMFLNWLLPHTAV